MRRIAIVVMLCGAGCSLFVQEATWSSVDGGGRDAGTAGSCPSGMAELTGGRYAMGSRGDTVTVGEFCMDVTEVTTDAYAVCVTAGACTGSGSGSFCNGHLGGKGSHPINCVDWGQAGAYCRAQGKRLPTEEEWEWAARGKGLGTTYPWGSATPSNQLCWSKSDGTCPTSASPTGDSPDGIHDLAGNVWEWTSSIYDASTRVVRGGSWNINNPSNMSAAYRRASDPTYHDYDIGFRCAKSP